MKIAINGFGRIGRMVLRSLYERQLLSDELEVVAINDIVPVDQLHYLLQYDTVHRGFPGQLSHDDTSLIIDNTHHIKALQIKDGPAALPWAELGIDLVIESTGLFAKRDLAMGHIQAGAKRVIITAPSDNPDITVIVGVNHQQINWQNHQLISAASCTTNCATPLLYVLEKEGVNVQEALLTTVHSYTATQALVDAPNKKNPRLGRNAANNIVPSSTGAAEAIVQAMPQLAGKITGMSIRVPTPAVSLVDLTIRTTNPVQYAEIVSKMQQASNSYLNGILAVSDDQAVSADFIHNPHSAILDVDSGIQLNEQFFKLIAWYDNEWGYSCRIADLAALASENA